MQLRWLTADLEAASKQRATTPWIVAGGHRPLYCSNHDKTQCKTFASLLRSKAEGTFNANGVDLVIQAHMHGYERSWPLKDGVVVAQNYTNPTAPVYVVNGAGGNREGNTLPRGEAWTAFRTQDVGYARLTVTSASLEYEFVDAANGTTLDAFTITRE